MENINISLGIELDKKQFNDDYIQGKVDNEIGGVKIRVDKVEVGKVGQTLQNDLSEEASKLKIKIPNVDIDETGAKQLVDMVSNVLEEFNNISPSINIDVKNSEFNELKNNLTKNIKNSLTNFLEESGIDVSKMSITGVKAAAENIKDEFKDEMSDFDAGGMKFIEDIGYEMKENLGKYLLDSRNAAFRELGEKYGLELSEGFIEEAVRGITNFSVEPFENVKDMYTGSNMDGLETDFIDLENKIISANEEFDALTKGFAESEDTFNRLTSKINDLKDGLLDLTAFDVKAAFDFSNASEEIQRINNLIKSTQDYYDDFEISGMDITDYNYLRSELQNIDILIKNISDPDTEGLKEVVKLFKNLNEYIYSNNQMVLFDEEFADGRYFEDYRTDAEQLKVVIDRLSASMREASEELENFVGNEDVDELTKYSATLRSVGLLLDDLNSGRKIYDNLSISELNNEYQKFVELIEDTRRKITFYAPPYMEDDNFGKDVVSTIDNFEVDEEKLLTVVQRALDSVGLDTFLKIENYELDDANLEERIRNIFDDISNRILLEIKNVSIGEDVKASLLKSIETVFETLDLNIDQDKVSFTKVFQKFRDDFEKNIDNVVSSANKRFSENLELNLAESEILGLDKVVEKVNEGINKGFELAPVVITPRQGIEEAPGVNLENQLSNIKEYAKKFGLEYSEEFGKAVANAINSGDFQKALDVISKEADVFIAQTYDNVAKKSGKEILAEYDNLLKQIKGFIGGNKLNVSSALLSDEEFADLKKQFGNVIYLYKDKGTEIAGVTEEIAEAVRSVGIDIDDSKLQDMLQTIGEIINTRRQLKADTGSIPSEYMNLGFNEEEYFTSLREGFNDLTANINKTNEEAKDLSNTLETVVENMSEDNFQRIDIFKDDEVRSADALQERLDEIKATAQEVSNISYTFDRDGNMKSALVTFKNEAGQTFKELLHWVKYPEEELEIFENKLISASEKLIDVTGETKKLTNQLETVKQNTLLDTSAFDEIEERIKSINKESTTDDIKKLSNEIKSLGKAETQLVKVDKAIADMQNKLSKLSGKGSEYGSFSSVVNTDEMEDVADKLEELIDLRSKLYSGESSKATEISTIINEMNLAYTRLSDTMNEVVARDKEIAKQNEQTAQTIAKLNDSMADMESKLNTSLQTRKTLGADTTYIENLKRELQSIDVESENAGQAIQTLSEKVNTLGKNDGQIQKVQDAIRKINEEIAKVKSLEDVGGILSQSDIKRVSSMEEEVKKLNTTLDKLQNGASYSGEEIKRMCDEGTRSMKDLSNSADDVASAFSGLGGTLNRAMDIALGFEIGELFRNQISQVKDSIIELDNEMVALRRVSNETESSYKRIASEANKTAVAMGKTTQETLYATTEFVKMGYSIDEASESLAKVGLTLSNVADMSIDEAVNAIVSTMKGLGLSADDATEIVDVINEAGNSFALKSSDLAEGLRIGSASLKVAGNDLYESAALITAGTEILQDSNKVANGLKTISLRLRGIAEEGGEVSPKLGELVKTITDVDITDTNGQFRSTYDILAEIAEVWHTLDTNNQSLLLEEIAGKTQVIISLVCREICIGHNSNCR